MEKDPFKEYLIESEPNKNKGYAWRTAIGLQAVDGLTTSQYLLETAIKNIGEIFLSTIPRNCLTAIILQTQLLIRLTEQRRLIKFHSELHVSFLKMLSVLRQMNIFLFIKNYLMVYTNT